MKKMSQSIVIVAIPHCILDEGQSPFPGDEGDKFSSVTKESDSSNSIKVISRSYFQSRGSVMW